MNAPELLQVLWRRKVIVASIALVVVLAALWSLSTAPDEYEARAKVALLPNPDNPQLVPFYGQAVESLLPTYAEILESISFLEEVAADLPGVEDADALKGAIRAEPVARVGVLDVVATSADPRLAQRMSESTARALVRRLADNGVVEVILLDNARVPSEPTAPSTPLVLAVSVVVGLLLGGMAAVLRDRFFGRINEASELSHVTDLPVLSELPEMRRLRNRSIVVGNPRLGELEERLRILRTNILFADRSPSGAGTTIITGLSPGDGKSTVAANLAVLTAELGKPVLLIDADLHRPVQHEFFGLSNDVGLTSVASWGLGLKSVIFPTAYPNLSVVPAGPPITERALEVNIYRETLQAFRDHAEIIIVDTPPLHAGDEVRFLAAFGAQVVLLVRAGATTPRQLQQDLRSLDMVGGEVLGLVLSRTEERGGQSQYRSYRGADPEEWDISSGGDDQAATDGRARGSEPGTSRPA